MTENGFKTVECDAVYELKGKLVAVDDQDYGIVTIELKHLISIYIGESGKLLINFDTDTDTENT